MRIDSEPEVSILKTTTVLGLFQLITYSNFNLKFTWQGQLPRLSGAAAPAQQL
jgi:hypothetical protein